MILTDRAALTLINRSAETVGVKLPRPVLVAQSRAETVAENARNLRPRHDEMALAVATALADDRDPTTDPEVQRLAVAQSISIDRLPERVAQAAANDLREAYHDRVDAVVAVFQKPYAKAADQLAAAHSVLGDVDLDKTTAVLNAGPAAAEAWAIARRALEVVDACAQAFSTLCTFTRAAHVNPHMSGLRYAAVDYASWMRHGWNAPDVKCRAWDLVRAGIPLSLPSPAEYTARVQALAAGGAAAQRELEAAELRALTSR